MANKYLKKSSISFAIMKMQIKAPWENPNKKESALKFHPLPIRVATIKKATADKDVGREERLLNAGGNADWWSHYGN